MEAGAFPLQLSNLLQEDEFFCDISLSSFTDSPFTTFNSTLNGSASPTATSHSRGHGAHCLLDGYRQDDAVNRVISASSRNRGTKPPKTPDGHPCGGRAGGSEVLRADSLKERNDTDESVQEPRSRDQKSPIVDSDETKRSCVSFAFAEAPQSRSKSPAEGQLAEDQEKNGGASPDWRGLSLRTCSVHLSDPTEQSRKLAGEVAEAESVQNPDTAEVPQSGLLPPSRTETGGTGVHVSLPSRKASCVCPNVAMRDCTPREEVPSATREDPQSSGAERTGEEHAEEATMATPAKESTRREQHLCTEPMTLSERVPGHEEDTCKQKPTAPAEDSTRGAVRYGMSTDKKIHHEGAGEGDPAGDKCCRRGEPSLPRRTSSSAGEAQNTPASSIEEAHFQSSSAVDGSGDRLRLSPSLLPSGSATSLADGRDKSFPESRLSHEDTPAVPSPGGGEGKERRGENKPSGAACSSSSASLSLGEADVFRAVACKKLALLKMKEWEDERQARSTATARLVADLTARLTSAVEQSIAVTSHTARYLRARSKADLDYARALKAAGSGGGRGKSAQTRYGFLLQGSVPPLTCARSDRRSLSSNPPGPGMEHISSSSNRIDRSDILSSCRPSGGESYASAGVSKSCLRIVTGARTAAPGVSPSASAVDGGPTSRLQTSACRSSSRTQRDRAHGTASTRRKLSEDGAVSARKTCADPSSCGRGMERLAKDSEASRQRNAPGKQGTSFQDSITCTASKEDVDDASRHWTPGSLYEDMPIDSASELPREENGVLFSASSSAGAFRRANSELEEGCPASEKSGGKRKEGLWPLDEQRRRSRPPSVCSDVGECTADRPESVSDQRSASTGSSGRTRRWGSAATLLQHFSPLQLGLGTGERKHSLRATEEDAPSPAHAGEAERQTDHVSAAQLQERGTERGSQNKKTEGHPKTTVSNAVSKKTFWGAPGDDRKQGSRHISRLDHPQNWKEGYPELPSSACSGGGIDVEGQQYGKGEVKETGRSSGPRLSGEELLQDPQGWERQEEAGERTTTAAAAGQGGRRGLQQGAMFPELSSTAWLLALLEMHDQNAFQMETLGAFVHGELVQDHLQSLCVAYDRETSKHLENLKRVRLPLFERPFHTPCC